MASETAWDEAGWPPHRDADGPGYRRVRDCARAYLAATFADRLSPVEQVEIVETTVRAFVAARLAADRSGPTVAEFHAALDDQGFRRLTGAIDEHPFGPRPATAAADGELTAALFAVDPPAVRAAMAELFREHDVIAFAIVTRYLDLAQREPGRIPTPTEVADALRYPDVTEQVVSDTVTRFRRRLGRIAS